MSTHILDKLELTIARSHFELVEKRGSALLINSIFMKKFQLSLFFLLAISSINAQNVTIKGTAKAYEYMEIGAYIATDFITNTQKQITYSVIDSSGNFLLEWNTKSIQYITLKIDKHVANIYVEPNSKYEISVFPPDSTTYQNPNLEHSVKISINLKTRTEINALTIDYEKKFDDFLSVEYKSFVSRSPKSKIDSFKIVMNSYYSTVNNSYFKNYITYSIAALEEKTNASEKKLFENYINKKPVLYNHVEYMNFFNTFYKQKLQSLSKAKGGNNLLFQINNRGSFSGTKTVLKTYNYLQNDTICELALIKGLYESYYDGTIEKRGVVALLQQAVEESTIEEHKQIASTILNSFSNLQKGVPAPFFELPDKTGLTHSLDELRTNKYVYITMFDSKCSSCMQQMKVIPSLKKQYGSRITFVSISLDPTNADLKNFVAKNPKYDWVLLYDNSLGKLKTDYEIKSLPAYFLINPDGKFVQVPADSPEEDIERVFYDIVKPKAKIHGIGDKRN